MYETAAITCRSTFLLPLGAVLSFRPNRLTRRDGREARFVLS